MAERVLVLTPASLVGQWREELETQVRHCLRHHLRSVAARGPARVLGPEPHDRLASPLARRREHAARLVARSFDLVIVDEAHHLRDRSSQSYKLVDALNKRFLLLLSATPVQNDLIELYNLLTLLKPGIFKTLKEFRAAYMTPGKPRQPANPERLRELMRGAMVRNTRAVAALKLPRRHAATIKVDGAAGEARGLRRPAAAPRGGWRPSGTGRDRLALHHLLGAAGSSPAAAARALRALRRARRRPIRPGATLAERWAAIGRRRQGGGADRAAAAQPAGEEARLRPFPRDARRISPSCCSTRAWPLRASTAA